MEPCGTPVVIVRGFDTDPLMHMHTWASLLIKT